MRMTLSGMVAGVLVAAALPAVAPAQRFVRPPTVVAVGTRTTVTVPDGGAALVGGYSRLAESRTSAGVPTLGRTPLLGRSFRNVGTGRSAVSARIGARVRVIDLREEEFRQTGFRSP